MYCHRVQEKVLEEGFAIVGAVVSRVVGLRVTCNRRLGVWIRPGYPSSFPHAPSQDHSVSPSPTFSPTAFLVLSQVGVTVGWQAYQTT